jgi:tyrosine-protein kinase Etk/Wzc
VGKSFLCVNLALVLGQAGKRVLLIDADMRKGHLNRVLGTGVGIGLSEFITGNADRDQVLTQFEAWRLDFIATGARPPNPSELLMHERLTDLLRWGAETYDYVVVDAPPVLAVTDAAIIGRHAGASLLVARAETNSLAELEESVKQMKQGGASVRGVILNGVQPHRGYRYGYRYGYRSQYRYADSK